MDDDAPATQIRISDYTQTTSQRNEIHECRVCGFTDTDADVIQNCHPPDRLDQERDAAVTATSLSGGNFRYPSPLHPAVTNFCEQVEAALQGVEQSEILEVTTDTIEDTVKRTAVEPQAFALYTNLVFLQQHRVLPGYPESAPTRVEPETSLRDFCTDHSQFDGDVTDQRIKDSPLLATERVYRAHVTRTTNEFFTVTPHLPDDNYWAWPTTATQNEQTGLTTAIFGDGAAHNTITIQSRNWLATHPAIHWVVAPHIIGSQRPADNTSDVQFGATTTVPSDEFAILDVAAFAENPDPQLVAGGFIIDDDTPREIYTAIQRMTQTHAAILLIFPSRNEIIQFITTAVNKGWFETDPGQVNDVAEYYNRKPSIPAITEEFTAQNHMKNTFRFLSWKQILDDITTPADELRGLTHDEEA